MTAQQETTPVRRGRGRRENSGNYSGVIDGRFKDILHRVDEDIERIKDWPFPMERFSDQFPYLASGQRPQVIGRQLAIVSDRGVIEIEDTNWLDREALRAFGVFTFSYAVWPSYISHKVELEQRVDLIKGALGNYPLAAAFHDPTFKSGKRDKKRDVPSNEVVLQLLESTTWDDLLQWQREVARDLNWNVRRSEEFWEPVDLEGKGPRFFAAVQLVMRAQSVWEGSEFDPSLKKLSYYPLNSAFDRFITNFSQNLRVVTLNGRQLSQAVDAMEEILKKK